MIRILQTGIWSAEQLSVRWTDNTRRIVEEVESAIDNAWATALARPKVHLFDGPMCRLETWRATKDHLALTISKSSYRIFVGTNMAHPEFADLYGAQVMANPVGVSPALLTSDGQLLLGRRSATVAYYPSRVHPFAGCMEPKDPDPFAAILRELKEELSLEKEDLQEINCIGIAEDASLRQPELIFSVRIAVTRARIEAQLDPVEHHSIWAIPAEQDRIAIALKQDQQLTPVARAALLLWGRQTLGQEWYDQIIAWPTLGN
jgi:8-oxo-dGTP pyrophosphatase MutT (NUDIX family)